MKQKPIIGGGIAFLYTISYLFLTVFGGYEPGKSGKFKRYNLPTHDIYIWQLRYGRDSPFHDQSTFLPAFYTPFLWTDRNLWHKELPMLREEKSGEIINCPTPPMNKMHPRAKRAYEIMASYSVRLNTASQAGSYEEHGELIDQMLKEVGDIYR